MYIKGEEWWSHICSNDMYFWFHRTSTRHFTPAQAPAVSCTRIGSTCMLPDSDFGMITAEACIHWCRHCTKSNHFFFIFGKRDSLGTSCNQRRLHPFIANVRTSTDDGRVLVLVIGPYLSQHKSSTTTATLVRWYFIACIHSRPRAREWKQWTRVQLWRKPIEIQAVSSWKLYKRHLQYRPEINHLPLRIWTPRTIAAIAPRNCNV